MLRDVAPRARRRELTLLPEALPRTRFSVPITSPHRIFDARVFDFEDWRRIKRAVDGATINDVALSIVGGALRHYLQHHDELPAVTLTGAIPISLRSKNHGASDGNDVASMIVSLRTDVADPLERLAGVHASTQASKIRKEAIGARTLTDISQQLPGRLIGIGLRAAPELSRRIGAVPGLPLPISNVPGSPTPLYFAGARMCRMLGMGPVLHGMGLLHIIGTYNGEATVSLTASRDIVPDLPFYADCIVESFNALRAASRRANGAQYKQPQRQMAGSRA